MKNLIALSQQLFFIAFTPLKWLIGGPFGGFFLALMTAFIGIWGSSKFSAIENALSPRQCANVEMAFSCYMGNIRSSSDAIFFIAIVLIFSLFFFWRDYLIKRQTNKREEELLQAINSLPSKDFISYLYYGLKSLRQSNVIQPESKSDSVDCIRRCLSLIQELAIKSQPKSPNDRFGVNVMVLKTPHFFKDFILNNPEYEKSLSDFMGMKCSEVCLTDYLRGVLIGLPELSVCKEMRFNVPFSRKRPEIDDMLVQMAMPLPERLYHDEQKSVKCYLPGAPSAIADEGGSYIIQDTTKLLEFFDESQEYDILRSVFKTGHEYFKETKSGKLVRSFVSIKLAILKQDSHTRVTKELTVGVVNIHSSNTNIFQNDQSFNDFRELIFPVLNDLSELVHKYSQNHLHNNH